LTEAIKCGSTNSLNFSGGKKSDGLFYFGRADGAPDYYAERLYVYDRVRKLCPKCDSSIQGDRASSAEHLFFARALKKPEETD
jgi:formamidopyrimidine-DNA glycosylase